MATFYTYSDDFVIDSIDPSVLEQKETDALEEALGMNIDEEPYKERFVVASTMRQLCILQLENDGMQEKLTAYNKDYDRYWNMFVSRSPTNIGNIPIQRG